MCLITVYGSVLATVVELSSCNGDCTALEFKIFTSWPFRKNFDHLLLRATSKSIICETVL